MSRGRRNVDRLGVAKLARFEVVTQEHLASLSMLAHGHLPFATADAPLLEGHDRSPSACSAARDQAGAFNLLDEQRRGLSGLEPFPRR